VWRELIRRSRLQGPAWVIATVGMAMPALRRYAAALCAGYPGDPADIDAELLAGFLAAVRDRVDLGRDAPHASVLMAAWRAGYALRHQDRQTLPVADLEPHTAGPRAPKPPYGHPDLLVRRAVVLGLVDAEDEQPYIDVRLGRRAIEPIAATLGISVDALRMRLGRIDTRLAQALADGLLTGIPSAQAARAIATQAGHRTATRAAARRRPAVTVRLTVAA
jgi:DNA-directed RNA polymerase specialized sigma24 family protein